MKSFDTSLAFPALLVSALVFYLAARIRCSLPGLNWLSFICTLVCVSFSALVTSPVPFPTLRWGDYSPQTSSRPPLPTEVLIYRQKRFLSKRSLFMGCTDVRKGIFNTLLTTLWQSMLSCTDESHPIKI